MRRLSIGLVLVVALLLMLTAIATAAPPNCDELPFEHPHYCGAPCHELDPDDPNWCETPPPTTTTTTTTTEPPTLEACPTEPFPIEVTNPGLVEFECLWTPEEPAGWNTTGGVEGKVTVTPVDGISQLLVFVRDDVPGDICLLAQNAQTQAVDGSFVGSFDLYYSEVPAFGDGVLDYSAWLHEDYWSFEGTNWCAPQDPVLDTIRDDQNGEPLHLWVRLRAKKDSAPITVNLTADPVAVTAGS